MSAIGQYTGPRNPRRPIPEGESSISIYGYTPSSALAAVALATFAITLIAHGFYLFKHKTTRTFQFLLCFGCLMEITGYSFRAKASSNPFVVNSFVVQYFMIVCAPVFFTAALYLSLSIAVRRVNNAGVLPVSPKKVVTFFVLVDVITTGLQVAGAALIGVSESRRSTGQSAPLTTTQANDILLAGLAVQSASFLIFLGLAALVWRRNKRHTVFNDAEITGEKPTQPVSGRIPSRYFFVLFLSSLAIWLRTLFRLAETAEGVFGYASTHESLFGTLEYTPVIIALLLWAVFPLEKILKR